MKKNRGMDITGKIIVVGEPRTGTSQRTGNEWKVREYVIETSDSQYPRKCAFEVFGEDKIEQFNIQMGEALTISIDIDAHEYKGRWYNRIRAWRVDRSVSGAAQNYERELDERQRGTGGQSGNQAARNFSKNDEDDLPF